MKSVKKEVTKLLKNLPDNLTWEDLQYHLYVRTKIERGLREVKAGRFISREEVKKRLAKWL